MFYLYHTLRPNASTRSKRQGIEVERQKSWLCGLRGNFRIEVIRSELRLLLAREIVHILRSVS